MNLVQITKLSNLYDTLYDEACEVLKKYSPCNIKYDAACGLTCTYMTPNRCCEGCKHHSDTGCTVRSLACKLYLCWDAGKQKKSQDALTPIRQRAWVAKVPMGFRMSKEENFAPYFTT